MRLADARVVVTVGGTREPIDPVRVITNRSTGKMGLALARSAARFGSDVLLVSSVGDGGLGLPTEEFETVDELRSVVLKACADADVLVMCAAVSDFRPVHVADQKIKKQHGSSLTLELVPVEDFSREISDHVFKVGFAAETRELLDHTQAKLERKGLQMICANNVAEPGSGFGVDTNRVTILTAGGRHVDLPLMPKSEAADHILREVDRELASWPGFTAPAADRPPTAQD